MGGGGGGGGNKTDNLYCCACPYLVLAFIYRRVHGIFYRLDLKGISNHGDFRKLAMDTLDPEMVKKMASDLKTMERNLDTHATCMVSSCQCMVAVVLF